MTACTPHRMDIRQGNFLTEDTVAQVEVGMNREQVRFLLGTPMVAPMFRDERWDYRYYLESQEHPDESAYLVVWFDGDVVERLDLRDAPER